MIVRRRGKAKERVAFRLGVGSEGEAAVHTEMRLRECLSALPLIIRAPKQQESTGTKRGENREQAICQPDMVYHALVYIQQCTGKKYKKKSCESSTYCRKLTSLFWLFNN